MKKLLAIATAALLSAPVLAHAQDENDRVQVGVNGGVGGYFGGIKDQTTNAGPAYGVTAGVPGRGVLSYELGYMGHSNAVTGAAGRLSSNQVQAGVKAGPELNAPVPWRPYLFGGIGANFIRSGAESAGLNDATQAEIPLGVGADFFTNSPIRVGARAQYNLAPGIGGTVSAADPHPDGWLTTLNAQAAF